MGKRDLKDRYAKIWECINSSDAHCTPTDQQPWRASSFENTERPLNMWVISCTVGV